MVMDVSRFEKSTYNAVLASKICASSRQSDVSFLDAIKAMGEGSNAMTGQSFEEMWKSKYPGAYYHVMDASKISQGVWERNDFPSEKFFQDKVDDSIGDWKPSGADLAMSDSSVQSRLNSTLGKKSIVVPPALEEKMKNDPELAKKVMNNVENFIATHPTRPGRILSYLISLDENGDIAHFRVTGGGGEITKSSSEMVDAYYERKEKEAERRRLHVKEQEKKAIEKRRSEHAEYVAQQIRSQQRLEKIFLGNMKSNEILVTVPNLLYQTNASAMAAAAYEQSSISISAENI
ncbi:MAG: hypothetical protein Q4D51_12530 [Eubacteriales bacterium]|nr:hypothetical protein [Eubacteriales bacterium]